MHKPATTWSAFRRLGLLLFLLLGLSDSLVTPLFEAPDEVWHYAYVRHLIEERTLPPLEAGSDLAQEVAQPPLYYVAAALVSGLAAERDPTALLWHNPNFGYQAGGTVNDNKNMLIHTEREGFPWRGAALAVRLARFVSLAFGLLTVVATWRLGREAFPDHPAWAFGAATLVALHPQFLFMSGVVSNDSAAAALSTAALWATVRTVHRGVTPRRALAVGLLIGLAALTKTSALLLWPLAAAALGLADGPAEARRALGRRAPALLLMTAAAAAVGGWWYLRNGLLYGDPLALQVHIHTSWGRAVPASLATLISELPRVYVSFWGGFGWGHVEYPTWIYVALGILPLVALAGWAVALVKRRLPGLGWACLLSALWLALVFAALLQWMRQVQAPHGRLLFPAIGAWGVLAAGGWRSAICNLPFAVRRPFLAVPLSALALLSLLTPWLVIRPAFALPRLLSPEEAAATVQPADLIYGDTARLLGVSLEQTSVAPGEWLEVRACWEATAPMARDYTVFIHLLGQDNARVGERYTYPGLGRFPTSLWPVGQAFCDTYRVHVEPWAPLPELADLLIGLYDAESGERLVARNSAGEVIELPVLARVRVAPASPPAVSPAYPLSYRLGESVELIGYDLSGPVRSGAPLTVTLYWRAVGQPAGDYTVFVHLLDETGNPLAQHDGPPRANRYPTAAWQPGDVVPDEHVLRLPALSPGQSVRLVTGMYDPRTMERLPVAGPEGPLPDGLVPLAALP